MQAKILKIYRAEKDKKGNAYMTKALPNKPSRPYTRISIQIDAPSYKDKWISGFENDENKNWKENDLVELTITEKAGTDNTCLRIYRRRRFIY